MTLWTVEKPGSCPTDLTSLMRHQAPCPLHVEEGPLLPGMPPHLIPVPHAKDSGRNWGQLPSWGRVTYRPKWVWVGQAVQGRSAFREGIGSGAGGGLGEHLGTWLRGWE